MSIASAIALKQQQIAAAYTACDEKGATMPAAGSQNLSNLADTISTISGGSPTPEPSKDIIFIDYDGTELYSYTYAQAAALSALPANPTHTGLTAQGWNWTLSEVQDAGTNKEAIIVGQLYTTTDGKTRVYFTAPDNNYWIDLNWYQSKANGVNIDFGDGSDPVHRNASGNIRLPHCFSTAGDYVITFEVVDGTINLGYNDYGLLEVNNDNGLRKRYTNSHISEINVGDDVIAFGARCLYDGRTNIKISVPTTVTTFNTNCFDVTLMRAFVFPRVASLPNYTFSYCQAIDTVSLPPTVNTINTYSFQYSNIRRINLSRVETIYNSAFTACWNLEDVDLRSIKSLQANAFDNAIRMADKQDELSLPNLTTIANSALRSCHSIKKVSNLGSVITNTASETFRYSKQLREVTLPSTITTIGTYVFQECQQLEYVNIPSGVTSIGQSAFNNCYRLNTTIPESVVSIGNNAFEGCWAFDQDLDLSDVTTLGTTCFKNSSIKSVILPSALTTLSNNVFEGCKCLRSVTIPSGYTTIGQYTFSYCGALEVLTLPATVTSIGQYAFYRASSLSLTVLATTPPTAGTAFFNEALYGAIYVPPASVSAYRTATNWTAHKGRIRPIGTPVYGSLTPDTKLVNGVETDWDGVITTDYIPIVDGHSFTFSAGVNDGGLPAVTWYDSSHNYISYYNANSWDRTATISSSGNAAYVRFTFVNGMERGRAYLYDNTTETLLWPTYITE